MYQYDFKEFARDGEQITVNESVYLPGMLPEHTHNFLEIIYLLNGKGVQKINGQTIPVCAGDLFVLGHNTAHTFIPDENGGELRWININFVPGFIDANLINEYTANEIIKLSVFRNLFFDEDNITYLRLPAANESYGVLIHLMMEEYNRHQYGCISCLKYYLIILLTKVFCDNLKDEQNSDTRWLLQTVLDELSESIAKSDGTDINLERFAQKAYMSPKSFSRLFRQKMGVGFTHFVQQKRIEKSCQLLVETDISINSIMLEVGYYDAKTFYTLFKRTTGFTPRQYRENARAKAISSLKE